MTLNNEKILNKIKPNEEDPIYTEYLPFYDPLETVEDLGEFDHYDVGNRADPNMPNLLKDATKVVDVSPSIGTEIFGVQLSQLGSAGLDELALLSAQRGVLVFRDQDFANIGFEKQKDIVKHFGPLHVHGWAPHPVEGPSEFMIIYDSKDDLRVRKSWKGQSPIQFHTDQAAEIQPPGTTFLCMLECPKAAGGDTIFSSGYQAYERLSPKFRKRLEGLRAVHCNMAVSMSEVQNNGSDAIQRRKVQTNIHPVVIVHPVTKKKALFVNPVYTERIVGMQKEESDALLGFLFNHIIRGMDFSCRLRYEPGTVVVWDQRVTCHSQTLDYPVESSRRHAFRLTSLANKPIPAKEDSDDERIDEYLYH